MNCYNLIERYSKGKINEIIPNSCTEHALTGLNLLINNADNKVRILSNYFYDDLWGSLIYSLKDFLRKGGSILEFIVLKDSTKEAGLQRLKKGFPDKVKIYDFPNKKISRMVNEFVTADNRGYRFELTKEQKKDKMISAIINFGDKSTTDCLNRLFGEIKLKCSEILIN